MTGEGIKKKRDPIFSVCFVVFVVACVGVLGVYVDEHYLQSDETKVAYGDKVTVDYVGSFYAYNGESNAVVFDTSIASVGKNDDISKANSFSKSSYSTFSVTVGSKGALEMFENALVGHKVGDTVKVMIPAGQGYIAPAGSVYSDVSTTFTVPAVQEMTKTQFTEVYGSDITLTAGTSVQITTAYGWTGLATLVSSTNMVVIQNMPTSGETYQYIENDDSKYGKVSYKVNSISADDISVTISFSDTKDVGNGEIAMIELNVDGQKVYVTGVGNGTYSYKTCQETYNIDLYFEITIKTIGE